MSESADILLVEDDLRLAELTAEYFCQNGFSVATESRGDQALTPPRRHSLGRPLPYQQADIPQAAPIALTLYSEETIRYYSDFRRVIPDFGVRTYVFLPRLPWV